MNSSNKKKINHQSHIFKKKLGITVIFNALIFKLFRIFTKESLPIFLRGGDIISINPQIKSSHEPELTILINDLANNGANDFLIDIGANIGLTSCQNGKNFNKVYCFEPNPLCFEILKVNAEIMLDIDKVSFFNFGLGSKNEKIKLLIPKNNWGGAYMVTDENLYDKEVLAKKDGLDSYDISNYHQKNVDVKSTSECIKQIFDEIDSTKNLKGIIKIDVEGMEHVVIQGIAESLPDRINLYIIFENWENSFNFESLNDLFKKRKVNIQKLDNKLPYKRSSLKIIKGLQLLFGRLDPGIRDINEVADKTGDVIIEIR